MNDVGIITLIAKLDAETEEPQDIFAKIESVSQKEFFTAAQTGFKAELKVTIWQSDYENQPIVEIDKQRYSVYRRYMRSDEKVELYLSSKAGL